MSGAIGLGGEFVSVREFLNVFMILGAHLLHGPLFLEHGVNVVLSIG